MGRDFSDLDPTTRQLFCIKLSNFSLLEKLSLKTPWEHNKRDFRKELAIMKTPLYTDTHSFNRSAFFKLKEKKTIFFGFLDTKTIEELTMSDISI